MLNFLPFLDVYDPPSWLQSVAVGAEAEVLDVVVTDEIIVVVSFSWCVRVAASRER